MTCRHARGDVNCSTQYPEYHQTWGTKNYVAPPKSPDVENFKILDAVQCGSRVVLKVQYPNCASCSYEGTKVLVYDNLPLTPLTLVQWKRIDPHFADPKLKRTDTTAPSPMARFPASDAGWQQAMWFASNYPQVKSR